MKNRHHWSGTHLRLGALGAVLAVTSLAVALPRGHAQAQPLDPAQIHAALMQYPIEEWQLPPGFAGIQMVDVAVEPENADEGELANIDVTIASGPDPLTGGAYTIYATAEQAEAAMARLTGRLGLDVELTSVSPALSAWPTFEVSAPLPSPPLGVSAVLIRMDSIVVAAFSGVPGQPAGNMEHARALAVLMAQQVEWLISANPG